MEDIFVYRDGSTCMMRMNRYINFINLIYPYKAVKYYFVILGICLILCLVSSLFFNSVHTFVPNPVYAQTTLSVTITNACEFDDGNDPNIFSNCLQFNDGATISFDNVRFSASSNAPVKQFICSLQRDGVSIPLGSDNTCTSSQITATATYLDLVGGNYQFTVTAVRDVDGPLGTQVDEESATSAVFRFTVLGAEEGSAAGLQAGLARDSLNITGNAKLYSSFFDLISEGETKFLNVKNIKPHTIIKNNLSFNYMLINCEHITYSFLVYQLS